MQTLPIYYNEIYWLQCRLDLIEDRLPGLNVKGLQVVMDDLDYIECKLLKSA